MRRTWKRKEACKPSNSVPWVQDFESQLLSQGSCGPMRDFSSALSLTTQKSFSCRCNRESLNSPYSVSPSGHFAVAWGVRNKEQLFTVAQTSALEFQDVWRLCQESKNSRAICLRSCADLWTLPVINTFIN